VNRRDFLKSLGVFIASLWAQPKLLLRRSSIMRHPQCIYVSPNGSDQNDGLSLETAKYTMGAALQAIEPVAHAESVIYASSYFHHERWTLGDNIIIAFDDDTLLKNVVIEGDK